MQTINRMNSPFNELTEHRQTESSGGFSDHLDGAFLARTISHLYHQFYVFNFSKKIYWQIFYHKNTPPISEQGTLEDFIIQSKNVFHPDDLPSFLHFIGIDGIPPIYCGGTNTIALRRFSGDKTECISFSLQPMDTTDSYTSRYGELLDLIALGCTKPTPELEVIENWTKQLQHAQFTAICKTCSYIFDVDSVSGSYSLPNGASVFLSDISNNGNFDEAVSFLAENNVHPKDQQIWLDAMLLGNILRGFAAGRKSISFDARLKNVDCEWVWYNHIIVPVQENCGLLHNILVVAQDITIRKKTQELETSGQLAMQASVYQRESLLRETRYQIIVEQTGTCIYEWILDESRFSIPCSNFSQYVRSNGAFYCDPKLISMFQLSEQNTDFLLEIQDRVHPDDLPIFHDFKGLMTIKNNYRELKLRLYSTTSTQYIWYKCTLNALFNQKGQLARIIGTILNVDQETCAQQALFLSNIRYKTILEQTDTIEFEYDAVTGQSYISPLLEEKFGITLKSIHLSDGFVDSVCVHPSDKNNLHKLFENCWHNKCRRLETDCRILNQEGNFIWCKITMDSIVDETGQISRILGTLRDIDRETRAYQALKTKLESDPLTGIWNQDSFLQRANELLCNTSSNYAVIMMDIHRFKVINDVYGMEGGNRALHFIGQVLRAILGAAGCYARMYADVFCLMVPYLNDHIIIALLERISAALCSPNFDYMIVSYFGICRMTGTHAIGASTLVERAGFAHKSVKKNTIRHWAFYDDGMRQKAIEDKQMESEMDSALDLQQFQIYLQPKYCLRDLKIEGAEALVRWIHPSKGLISPAKFIPLFEENGFIIQLDMYVWEETCKLLRHWLDSGKQPAPISVNVSRLHIYNSDFKNTITGLIQKYDLPPSMIELELTESLFFDNMANLLDVLQELRQAGFLLSMDDFGSGYSSLNMLKSMPLDVLKIDCEFFSESGDQQRGRTVVRHTVAMAHELNMRVVAEGVETASQSDFLAQTNCDTVQGFYFARPMPVKDFEKLAFGSSD